MLEFRYGDASSALDIDALRAYAALHPLKSTFILVAVIVTAVALVLVIWQHDEEERRARRDLRRELDALSAPYRVTVNGDETKSPEPEIIVDALRTITPVAAHDSGPEQSVRVVIHDGTRTIEVRLAQDSKRNNEFWVFYPRGGPEAGRITDPRLPGWLLPHVRY